MSSSQDSDIELECGRIIKPRKIVPKFISSIDIDDTSTESEGTKSRLKKNRKDQSFQDKIPSNSNNKFARRLPIAFNILNQGINSNNYKNLLNHAEGSTPISQNPSESQLCSSIKNKKPRKLKFFEEDSQRLQETGQQSDELKIKNKQPKKINKTCHDSFRKSADNQTENFQSKYQQKTTPIFTHHHRNRTQLIKEFHKEENKIRTNWQKSLINGYTEIDYADKGRFRGIFQQGEIVSGQMTFPNGFIYTGQFAMFVFHGLGKLRFPSGQIFQGNWLFGSLNGNGKITYPKGQIYYGHINNFKRDGEGYLYFENGNKYTGQFYEGQITGYGELHKDGICTHKGFWIDGKFIGSQEQIY